MIESELFAFMEVFRNLQRVFPKRLDEHDQRELGTAYFKALRRFSLRQVTAGADIWVGRGKFFPKPAEWAGVVPAERPREVTALRVMTPAETATYLDAERRHYEGEPCRCDECRAAGVDHRFLRFVPNFTPDDSEDKARIADRVVVTGHWAHGEELRRWYVAREHFFGLFGRAIHGKTMPGGKPAKVSFNQRLDEIFKKRANPVEGLT